MKAGPQTVCTYPGCNALIPGTERRCARHPYPRKRHYDGRATRTDRGYDERWYETQQTYLREHPLCEIRTRCNGDPAVEVDHIQPIRRGGDRLAFDNLQATCWACHVWKTAKFDKRGLPFTRRGAAR